MTFEEANEACKKLSALTLQIWSCKDRALKRSLKDKYMTDALQIIQSGFKLKSYVIGGEPTFIIQENKNAKLAITNNRPEDVHVHGDCTTRCISLCTKVDYKVIRDEQDKNSTLLGYGWKYHAVWSKSLESRGFVKISFIRKMARKTLISLFSHNPNLDDIIATHSSRHLAAIDLKLGKVLDIFDSTGGRVDYIYVPASKKDKYLDILKVHGYARC